MIDIVKLRTIYLTMQKLSAGENPFSPGKQLSLDDPKVQQCFSDISEVVVNYGKILNVITSSTDFTIVRNSEKSLFNIKAEDINKLQPNPNPINVSTLAKYINDVLGNSSMKPLSGANINNWLLEQGLIAQDENGKSKVATDTGISVGIAVDERIYNGVKTYVNMYTPQAQQFIFDHLVEIAAFLQASAKTSGEPTIDEYPIPE